MNIRSVTVELLRAGPRHNQLISPLTQYLGVCGNAPAGRITLPYEHGDLEQRLQELRYGVASDEDPARRSHALERTGRDMAEILSGVPGVSGVLNPEEDQTQTLTHLRIVLSASELAMLPFEAAKIPTGTGAGAVWLALQSRAPVCITRHIRSVSSEGIRWPTAPRILFIAGPDTPLAEHRRALEDVMTPWRRLDGSLGDTLVILDTPTLATISREVTAAADTHSPFSHVHILAHGKQLDERDRYSPVGVVLNDTEDPVSGARLATALTSVTDSGVSRPAVITLASCDSAKQPGVRTIDASVAHNLHDQGIPLVVASQFPLTIEGSIPFVERFYWGQLWGEHPLVSLYAVRMELHSRMGPDTHDWASLVVYEAFPADLADQLENLRYWQTSRTLEGALQRLEGMAPTGRRDAPAMTSDQGERLHERFDAGVKDVEHMASRLPKTGPYTLECAGLRAAGQKRIGMSAFQIAAATGPGSIASETLLAECLNRMDAARAEYWRATKSFLAAATEPARRKASLHWLLGQVLSLDVVLGRSVDATHLNGARLAAEVDLESAAEGERAWAYVSLSELALLRLTDPAMTDPDRARCAEQAMANAVRFLELVGRGSEQAKTTARQFDRYIDWWGNPALQWALDRLGIPPRLHWHAENGMVPLATRLVELLRGRQAPLSPVRMPREDTAATAVPSDRTVRPPAPAPAAVHPATVDTSASLLGVTMLPAENGDCLLVEYGAPDDPSRVLIDCGARSAVKAVADWIAATTAPRGHEFELFVLTHIDADHIDGVLTLFDTPGFDVRFGDVWFNGWRQIDGFLSVKQGDDFSRLLEDPRRGLAWNRAVTLAGNDRPAPVVLRAGAAPPSYALPGGLQLTVLSPGADQLGQLAKHWRTVLNERTPAKAMLGRKAPPTPVTDFTTFTLEALANTPVRRDTSVANGSSIALLAEFERRAVLLTGDAHAHVLVDSIRALQRARGREGQRLKLDAMKLSHHGSANATTSELLSMVDCRHYLVSTSGNIFYHPDREAIARVILQGGARPTLHFNYRSACNELWDSPVLKERYGYAANYPRSGTAGLQVLL